MSWTSSSGESARPAIPVIVGPTGVGKTAVALEMVDKFNLEIVSCDSRQIYKYLDIGTAKPTKEELQGRNYHLVDYVEPTGLYSAARYRDDAIAVIDRIIDGGKVPLIVGGTGLYLKALISGFFVTPPPDLKYRAGLENLSNLELYKMLEEIDIEAAKSIPINNRVRIARALEIRHLTGHSKTELSRTGPYPEQRYEFCIIELNRSREKLYQFINLRVDKMIGTGLIEEVAELVKRGFSQSTVLRQTVGYREVLEHLEGRIELDKCIELIKQKSRNYAKRQLTWFHPDPNIFRMSLEDRSWREQLIAKLDKFKLDT